MCSDPQNSTSEQNSNAGTNNTAEVDNDDSGVSVSGNLSQSDSTSGSGSDGGDGESSTTERGSDQGGSRQAIDGANGSQNRQEVDENHGTNSQNNRQEESINKDLIEVQHKAEKLAEFIISHTLDSNTRPSDEVEETLLRCAKALTNKHQILFNGMMRRIRINEDTAYNAFITVANELFEGERLVVNWGRIVTFYAFGGQLALYCKEKQLTTCQERIPIYIGRYAKEVISNFVHNAGGWAKLCEEFPPEDEFDNTVWRVLTWTAVGLGLATAASFLASN